MMKSKLLFPLVPMLLLAACTSRSTGGGTFGDEVTLVASDTANFEIDESTYYLSKAMYQFEDEGREYLYFQNSEKGNRRIIIYDIEKESVHKSIPLYQQGPHSVPSILGGYPLGMDRFLITTSSPYIYMLNDKGHRVFRSAQLFKWDEDFDQFCLATYSSYYARPLILRDSLIYFEQNQIGYPHTKDTWKTSNIFASMNLQTGELATTKFCYPSVFDGEEITRQLSYEKGHSYADTGKDIVVSFHQTDSIYVSSDFEHVRDYHAQSRYFPSLRPKPYDVTRDITVWLRKKNMQPDYWHLLYDKYRKVFYRFARMPYEYPAEENPMRDEDKGREFSIVILNDKYEIIGETRFPGNTYNYHLCFVGKKGLYLSLNNQGNPDFSEDVLSMVCFTLADVE